MIWCKLFLHACVLLQDVGSQQVSRPLQPSCSPGAAHWWHQLVWKWLLVPPHHCGTNIATQGFHRMWRTAVVRGQERKPGQMMIQIHHSLLLPDSHFSISLEITLSPLRLITPYGWLQHVRHMCQAHTHTHTHLFTLFYKFLGFFVCDCGSVFKWDSVAVGWQALLL